MGRYYRKKTGCHIKSSGGAGQLCVDEVAQGTRLDVYLTGILKKLTRSQVQRLIEEAQILVNGQQGKANYKVKTGDVISYQLPEEKPLQIVPENIPLEIVYEDNDVLVINKPQGMVVHPANGNYQGTLVNALLGYGCPLSSLNGKLRPGIVHRIDKDTSGLLVVAKNDEAHRGLAEQVKEHEFKREYLALVHGVVDEPGGIIEAPIGRDLKDRQKMAVVFKNSKPALTRYWVLERFADYSLVKCQLETGRTHQIRVHMAYLHHPVAGDPKYGYRKEQLKLAGQALHAATLGFKHPRSQEWVEFSASLPAYFQEVLQSLGSKYIDITETKKTEISRTETKGGLTER